MIQTRNEYERGISLRRTGVVEAERKGDRYNEAVSRKMLAHIWSENDCWGDYSNYQRCMNAVKNYDRKQAVSLIQDLLEKYKVQIDEWAYLCGGQYMQSAEFYKTCTSIQVICDLHYIGFHIPAYALLREGKTKEAEELMRWMEGVSYRNTCHEISRSV